MQDMLYEQHITVTAEASGLRPFFIFKQLPLPSARAGSYAEACRASSSTRNRSLN